MMADTQIAFLTGCTRQETAKSAAPSARKDAPPKSAPHPSASQKIIPNGIYNGVFISDDADIAAIEQYENLTDEHLDIVLLFHSFAKGFDFPKEECDRLALHGSAAFIKLEPWDPNRMDDTAYSLQNIISGKLDKDIKKFAEGAKEFGNPVFISFGHEMNGYNRYPWSQKPELYKKAYKHIVDIFRKAGANNVTWVWNVDRDPPEYDKYYPGKEYVDWIACDGYSTSWSDNPKSSETLFKTSIEELNTYGKPILIGETGYDLKNGGNAASKKTFLLTLPEFCKKHNIAGFLYLNTNKKDEGITRYWELSRPDHSALKQGINKYQKDFDTAISLGAIQEHKEQASHSSKTNPSPAPSPAVTYITNPKKDANKYILSILNNPNLDSSQRKDAIREELDFNPKNQKSRLKKTIDDLIRSRRPADAYDILSELLLLKSKSGVLLIDYIDKTSGENEKVGLNDPWFSANFYRKFAEVCMRRAEDSESNTYANEARIYLLKAENLIAKYYRQYNPFYDNFGTNNKPKEFVNNDKARYIQIDNFIQNMKQPIGAVNELFYYIEADFIDLNRLQTFFLVVNQEDPLFDVVVNDYSQLRDLKERRIKGLRILDLYDKSFNPKNNNPWLKVQLELCMENVLLKLIDRKNESHKKEILSAKNRKTLNTFDSFLLAETSQELSYDEKISVLEKIKKRHLDSALKYLVLYYHSADGFRSLLSRLNSPQNLKTEFDNMEKAKKYIAFIPAALTLLKSQQTEYGSLKDLYHKYISLEIERANKRLLEPYLKKDKPAETKYVEYINQLTEALKYLEGEKSSKISIVDIGSLDRKRVYQTFIEPLLAILRIEGKSKEAATVEELYASYIEREIAHVNLRIYDMYKEKYKLVEKKGDKKAYEMYLKSANMYFAGADSSYQIKLIRDKHFKAVGRKK